MDKSLDRQFATFLRQRRGQMTYVQFSRKTGLPPSTLFRLENGQQSITLAKLHGVLRRLRVDVPEVFPE
ncbi:MAG: helix-turn-helix domain-containing protein [Limisphaerales bacterium]